MRRLRPWALLLLSAAPACHDDMYDQPRFEPLEANPFFEDGRASRPLVPGTVARGHLREDAHLYAGLVGGEPAAELPFPATREVLERGRERYTIFCSPCHDRVGYGRGMIVERGFRQPASFHTDRMREMPVGHFFDVMTNGFGAMYSYAERVPVEDRWAIAAWIRVLQRSQNARLAEVPPIKREQLEEAGR